MSGTLAFAYAAGALSTVNPCGFALLPAFLAYYLGQETTAGPRGLASRLTRGAGAGLALSAGYVTVFAVAGLLLAAGLRLLIQVVPWVAVAVGAGLVVLGVALLTGRQVGIRINPGKLGSKRSGLRGVTTFGMAYAVASLSCTLAVLLAVIGQALAAEDLIAVVGVFVAYAAGAASVLVLLAISAAAASGALAALVRRTLPYAGRISGAVLMLSGAYLLTYWVPQLAGNRDGSALSRGGATIAGTLAGWLDGRTTAIGGAAAVVLVLIAVLAVLSRRRHAPEPHSALTADAAGDDCCAPPATETDVPAHLADGSAATRTVPDQRPPAHRS